MRIALPTPKYARYLVDQPTEFGLFLQISFFVIGTIIVCNLYYSQPLLTQFTKSFNATETQISRIPALLQAGYAVGLVLIIPLGDLVRRRPLVLLLFTLSTLCTIPLAVNTNLVVFEVFSFLIGVSSVTVQVLLPLSVDMTPASKRSTTIGVMQTSIMMGTLLGRLLAGVVAEFVDWHYIYYMAIGLQLVALVWAYLVVPDYPAKGQDLTYWGILWSMAKLTVTEPTLIQACLINISACAVFSNFWVTLTFLLTGSPYFYSTLTIGLFGLVGMAGVAMGPLVGILVDKLVPWHGCLIAILCSAVFQGFQTAWGGVHIACVIVVVIGTDVFRQTMSVSLATAVFSIAPELRARLNAMYMLSLFIGQVIGTSVGTLIFEKYGWRPAAALSLGFSAHQLIMLLLRGPHCKRYTWFGYEGGIEWRKSHNKDPGLAELEGSGQVDETDSRSIEPPMEEEKLEHLAVK